MPANIAGNTYYRTNEVITMAGISRATLHRWIKTGKVNEASKKYVRGWRLFTEKDVQKIKLFAETTVATI
jgi:predicted site-specific integrase-resolvase